MNNDSSNNFTHNNLEISKKILIQQELDVNLQQQTLVNKRINVIKESFHEIPNTDPDYSILLTQMEMDQIELDELRKREEELIGVLESIE